MPQRHVAIKIDEDLHRRLHAAASHRGQRFHIWIEEALAAEVQRQEDQRFADELKRRRRST